jgi:hypothetical protein
VVGCFCHAHRCALGPATPRRPQVRASKCQFSEDRPLDAFRRGCRPRSATQGVPSQGLATLPRAASGARARAPRAAARFGEVGARAGSRAAQSLCPQRLAPPPRGGPPPRETPHIRNARCTSNSAGAQTASANSAAREKNLLSLPKSGRERLPPTPLPPRERLGEGIARCQFFNRETDSSDRAAAVAVGWDSLRSSHPTSRALQRYSTILGVTLTSRLAKGRARGAALVGAGKRAIEPTGPIAVSVQHAALLMSPPSFRALALSRIVPQPLA